MWRLIFFTPFPTLSLNVVSARASPYYYYFKSCAAVTMLCLFSRALFQVVLVYLRATYTLRLSILNKVSVSRVRAHTIDMFNLKVTLPSVARLRGVQTCNNAKTQTCAPLGLIKISVTPHAAIQ